METTLDLLDLFKNIDIVLTEEQILKFERYKCELLVWNPRSNLISKNDESRIVERHFFESAALVGLGLFNHITSVLDLGTGAGFPGVPIKIIKPQITLTLMDSRKIKTLFLKNLVKELSLENVSVVCERAENLKNHQHMKNKFDVVLSRAVGDVTKVFQWAQPFLKKAGVFVTIKGTKLEDELQIFQAEFPSAIFSIIDFPSILKKGSRNQKIVCVRNESLAKTI